MKNNFLSLSAVVMATVIMTSCNSAETNEAEVAEMEGITANMNLDAAMSEVTWKGDMLNLYAHEGTIALQSGDLKVENGEVKSGMFTIDMTTIKPTDDGFDEEKTPEKLIGHLSSDDFFNVEKFPTATFNVTGSEGSTVMGDLTVRGKTNPEKVENVLITEENGKFVVTGDLTFDRTKYDVNFSTGVQDKVLSDDITLKIKAVGTK